MKVKQIAISGLRAFLVLTLLSFLPMVSVRVFAQSQGQPQSQPVGEAQKSGEAQKGDHPGVGQELAKESRKAAGEEEEENANLKYSAMVRKLAKVTGLSVRQAYLAAVVLNFVIIAFLFYWFGRKAVPGMLRSRTASIQQALEEARAASQEANRRLAEIEARLRKLDVEIGQMQAAAEKETDAEEVRILGATEEDIRKVVLSAEQEIATAAKQARRELTAHTADLAIALARQQIRVDAPTDQSLVRNFTGKLSSQDGGKDRN